MSENLCIYPPTPEHVDQCSTTPPLPAAPLSRNSRIRNFIKSISESDIGTANSERGDGAQSPPNCAICLGKISSKCFTDSCMHQFCFSCLLEWSKIKAECPLCKQTFKSIIHNVNAKYEFSEHKVESFDAADWSNFVNQYILLPSIPNVNPRFSSNNREGGGSVFQLHEALLARFCILFQSPVTPLIDRFAREHANETIPLRSNGTEWRSYVYQRNLYALPLLDVNGRSRDISATFYRQNPAQVHRLMPWINRELIGLVNSAQLFSNVLLQRIEELVMLHDMTSVAFRRQLSEHLNRYTTHFIHELTNFARSPFDMIGYDRNVQYRPYFEEDVESLGSTDSLDTVSTISDSMFNIAENLLSTHRDALSNRLNRLTSRIQENFYEYICPQVVESVQIDSDDSDVVYVSHQKPPHLRTPEQVELNSDTDSDVQFVNDEIGVAATATASSNVTTRTTKSATTATTSLSLSTENSIGVQTSQPSSPITNSTITTSPNISIQCGNSKLAQTQTISVDIDSDSWTGSSSHVNRSMKSKRQRKWERHSSNDSDGFTTIIKVNSTKQNKSNELPTQKTTATTSATTNEDNAAIESNVNCINFGASTSSTTTAAVTATTTQQQPLNNRRSVITKNYARPKRRISSKQRKKMLKSVYESSSSSSSNSSDSDSNSNNSSNSSNGSSSNSCSSSSTESSHEEYSASMRKTSSRSSKNRRKPMTQQRKRRRKTQSKSSSSSTTAKKRQKLDVIRLKKDKSATTTKNSSNYRLIVSNNDSSDDDLDSNIDAKESDRENVRSSISSEQSSSEAC